MSTILFRSTNALFSSLSLQIDVFKVESYNVSKVECISIGHDRNDIGKLIENHLGLMTFMCIIQDKPMPMVSQISHIGIQSFKT